MTPKTNEHLPLVNDFFLSQLTSETSDGANKTHNITFGEHVLRENDSQTRLVSPVHVKDSNSANVKQCFVHINRVSVSGELEVSNEDAVLSNGLSEYINLEAEEEDTSSPYFSPSPTSPTPIAAGNVVLKRSKTSSRSDYTRTDQQTSRKRKGGYCKRVAMERYRYMPIVAKEEPIMEVYSEEEDIPLSDIRLLSPNYKDPPKLSRYVNTALKNTVDSPNKKWKAGRHQCSEANVRLSSPAECKSTTAAVITLANMKAIEDVSLNGRKCKEVKNNNTLLGEDQDSKNLLSPSPSLNSPTSMHSPTRLLKTLEIIIEPIELPSYILSDSNNPEASLEADNSSSCLVSPKFRSGNLSVSLDKDTDCKKLTKKTKDKRIAHSILPKRTQVAPTVDEEAAMPPKTSDTLKEDDNENAQKNPLPKPQRLNHHRNHCWYMRVPPPAYSAALITVSQLLRHSEKLHKNQLSKTCKQRRSSFSPTKTKTTKHYKYSTLNLIGRLRKQLKGKLKGKLSISKPSTALKTPHKSTPIKDRDKDCSFSYPNKTDGKQKRLPFNSTPGDEAKEVFSANTKTNSVVIGEQYKGDMVKNAQVNHRVLSTPSIISPYFTPDPVKADSSFQNYSSKTCEYKPIILKSGLTFGEK